MDLYTYNYNYCPLEICKAQVRNDCDTLVLFLAAISTMTCPLYMHCPAFDDVFHVLQTSRPISGYLYFPDSFSRRQAPSLIADAMASKLLCPHRMYRGLVAHIDKQFARARTHTHTYGIIGGRVQESKTLSQLKAIVQEHLQESWTLSTCCNRWQWMSPGLERFCSQGEGIS